MNAAARARARAAALATALAPLTAMVPLATMILLAALPARAQQPAGDDGTRSPASAAETTIVLRGEAAGGSVPFGRPFELDVVRRWRAGREPEPWSSEALAPLVVDELEVARGATGDLVVETRRCRAFVFRRGGVTLLPESREPITLLVDSCLPEGDDGTLELPPLPPLGLVAGRRALGEAAALAAAAGFAAWLALALARALRRRSARAQSPRVRLAARVDALAARMSGSRDDQRADAVEATAILREAARLAADAGTDAAPVDTAVLASLEDVKFAGHVLDAEQRALVIAGLRAAVAAVPHAPQLPAESTTQHPTGPRAAERRA